MPVEKASSEVTLVTQSEVMIKAEDRQTDRKSLLTSDTSPPGVGSRGVGAKRRRYTPSAHLLRLFLFDFVELVLNRGNSLQQSDLRVLIVLLLP